MFGSATRSLTLGAILLIASCLLLASCRAAGPAATAPESSTTNSPASQPASQSATQPALSGTLDKLADDAELYIPEALPKNQRTLDVLVHFHGVAHIVRREADAAGLRVPVVIVNYKGLSGAYEKPYSEPTRFVHMLDAAMTALRERGYATPDASWRHVCLSSFSAGYGAVRAILARDADYARIDGVYLADSLYAGWADEAAHTGASAANIAPFRKYAADAAAGRKTLIVSHSYYDPQKYAGTHVTADDLIAFVGAKRRAVDLPGPADMRIVSRAEMGQFKVWGCTAPAEEHGRHLQNMHYWLVNLPLERAGG